MDVKYYKYLDSIGLVELPANYDFVKGKFLIKDFHLTEDLAMIHFYKSQVVELNDNIVQVTKVLKLKEKKLKKLAVTYRHLVEQYPEEFL
jgi:hypothetical protein